MAYKFQTGALNTSGTLNVENAITGNALLVDSGGITVSAGNIVASTAQLTASAISASSAQFGAITVPTLSSTNLDLTGYLDVKGATRLSGTVGLGDNASDIITVNGQITGSLFDINGGTIDGASIGASVQSTGQFTTLSASSTLQAGGAATIGSGITVNGAVVSIINNRLNLGVDGGGVSVSGSGQAQFGGAATIGGLVTANAGIKSSGADLKSLNQKIVVRDAGDANDKAFLDGSGQVSGSGALNIGGAGVVAGNFTVNGAQTTVQQLTASFSTLGAAKATSLSASGDVTVGGNLQVNGTTTYVNSTNLTVTDKKVVIATGSINAAAADGAGIYIGNDDGTEYASLSYDGPNDSWDLRSVNGLHLSGSAMGIKIDNTMVVQKSALFNGAITGSNAGVGFKLKYATVTTSPFTPALSEYVLGVDTSTTAITINLPAPGAGDVGRVLLIKDVTNNASVNNITIAPNGTDTIDGVNASVKLESNSAAVQCIVTAANKWGLF